MVDINALDLDALDALDLEIIFNVLCFSLRFNYWFTVEENQSVLRARACGLKSAIGRALSTPAPVDLANELSALDTEIKEAIHCHDNELGELRDSVAAAGRVLNELRDSMNHLRIDVRRIGKMARS